MKQPPCKLSDFTLSQWVGYQNKYGQDLDNRLIQICKMQPGEQRENAYLLYDVDYHQQNYAWYTDTPLEDVLQMDIAELCKVQGAAFIALKKEQVLLKIHDTHTWNNEHWKIQPVYKTVPHLTKYHYDIATDIALIFSDLQDGKHEALYELCGAYLRHPGEEYTSELLDIRKEVMKDLPFNLVLCVKQYIETDIKKLFGKKK